MMELLDIVLPIFLVIALGAGLRAAGFISRHTDEALARLVFNVAAPALLFRSTARTSMAEAADARVLLALAGVTIVAALAVYLGAWRLAAPRRGVVAQGAHRSNMVFVGLPIVANAYGEAGLAVGAVIIGVMVVLYNLLAVIVLTLPREPGDARRLGVWSAAGLKSLRNPLILGCAGGMLWSAFGVPLPASLDRTLELVGRIALPLALLSVGAGLDLGRLRPELPATVLVSALKLVVYPGLVWVVLRALGLQGLGLAVPVLLMAAPTAVVSYVMAREMEGDERLAGAIVIGTTLLSLVTYLAWLILLRPAVV